MVLGIFDDLTLMTYSNFHFHFSLLLSVHVSFGYCGAHLGIVVLINPTSEYLSQELRSLLAHPSVNKHVTYGGHSLEGTGDWVLHDDTYTLHDVSEVFGEPAVDAALLKVLISQEFKGKVEFWGEVKNIL